MNQLIFNMKITDLEMQIIGSAIKRQKTTLQEFLRIAAMKYAEELITKEVMEK